MDKSKSASIAKWGAACAACALAKAKCIRTNEAPGVKCDRCDRLDKDCTNQVHKPRKKRQSKPSKTAQLEERLNSLVDLLKASNGGEIPPGTNIKDYARDYARDFDGCFSSYNSSRASPASTSPPESIAPTFQPFGENGHMPCNCRPVDVNAPLQVESDDTLLAIFMTQLMPQFPFITLRPGLRAAELAAEKPFLFSTIKMIASYHNLKSMRAQSYYIMKHLYEHMMMRADRSLEMLQVVLLILGYYHYHCMLHAQMGNLASLAVSLAADIGINRAPELSERSRLTVLHHEPTRPRSNEERRALCGVWYMNSVVALAFQRLDPIRYTPYLEQCMKDLEVAREYETDYLIVNLVRIQHLTERISQLHAKEHLPQDLQDISRAPMNVYLDAFQQELDKYRHGLPRSLQNNKLITCHINTATLRLWEPPIIDAAMLEKLGSSFQTLSLSSTYASHLGIFYKCNAALKQWFSFWLGLDTSEYFLLPMPACAQLINAITMLSRWAKLCGTEPGLSQVPAVAAIKTHIMTQPELQIDIGGILDAMVSRFDEARRMLASQEGGSWDNNIWDLATKKMRLTQMRLERWADTVAVHESFATGRYLDSRESSTGASSSFNSPALDKAFPLTVLDPSSVTSAPNCHAVDRHHGGMMDTTGGLHLNQALWQAVGMNQPTGSASWGSAVDIFDNMELDQNFFFDTSSDYNTIVLNTMGQTPSM